MSLFLPALCLITALALLVILSVIDLRVRLLPNVYVLPLAICGVIFHVSTGFSYLPSPHDMLIGGGVGFMMLYLLRATANRYYGQDALGLGDVKLMGAAGLWLGIDGVLFAMTLGAVAGLIHGLGYAALVALRNKAPLSLSRLEIPAGPGFALGIIAVAGWYYHGVLVDFVRGFFS